MKSIPLNFVRELSFFINGERRSGKLSIRELSFSPVKQKWECHWSLDYLYPEAVSFTGDDPLQALTRTLDFAANFIRGSGMDGHKLHWQYEGDNAGLDCPLWKADARDYNSSYCAPLVGKTLSSVKMEDFSWYFLFPDNISVQTESSWRFLTKDGIAVTSVDHGQQFGLSAPLDAAQRVLEAVADRGVVEAYISQPTGELIFDFGDHFLLQFLQVSCGYESWRLSIGGAQTVCTGGGKIVHFDLVP